RATFSGIDARWMRSGVQLRAEFLFGHPFDGVSTKGWYVDALVHRLGMGPVTAVARVEKLDYDAGPFSSYLNRQTLGVRVRLTKMLAAQVNSIRQPSGLAGGRRWALDAGLLCSVRF